MAGKARKRQPATYRVMLGYDGRPFIGFARQPDGLSVEAVIRSALAPYQHDRGLALAVGGRTDKGVHATGQVISFRLPPVSTTEIQAALGTAHPGVWVDRVEIVPSWFNARACARSRAYVYLMPTPARLDIAKLQRQLDALCGRRCFFAFSRGTPPGQDTQRRLWRARVRPVFIEGQPHLQFELEADRFLRRMVRILVATAVMTARGKNDDALVEIARSQDRTATAKAAPPEGLYLRWVRYAPEPVRNAPITRFRAAR